MNQTTGKYKDGIIILFSFLILYSIQELNNKNNSPEKLAFLFFSVDSLKQISQK